MQVRPIHIEKTRGVVPADTPILVSAVVGASQDLPFKDTYCQVFDDRRCAARRKLTEL